MTKIRFNCPSCEAKLKVPASLAGVAGPCPKCGSTIVAPLQSEEPEVLQTVSANASRVQSASAVATQPAPQRLQASVSQSAPVQQSVAPAQVAQQPVIHQPVAQQPIQLPPVFAPQQQQRVIQQTVLHPAQQQAPFTPPAPAPVQQSAVFHGQVLGTSAPQPSSNQVGFPRPLEQVSRTAAVALAKAPSHYPQFQMPGPVATPKYDPGPAPIARAPERSRSAHNLAPHPQRQAEMPKPVEPADLMPEDIFNQAPSQNSYSRYETYVPRTQPIVLKKKPEEPAVPDTSQVAAMPRLDVSLGHASSGALSVGQPPAAGPTVIQLPEIGNQADPNQFLIKPPRAERPPYRPPTPTPLAPPAQEEADSAGSVEQMPEPPREEGFDYSYQVQPEFPIEEPALHEAETYDYGYGNLNDQDGAQSGSGSVAAFLAEAMHSQPVGPEKSKDEILDELLGVSPKSKKKQGISGTTKFMFSVLVAVALSAGIGVYYAINHLGGFGISMEDVQGEEGINNLQKKTKSDLVPPLVTDKEATPGADPGAPPEKIDFTKDIEKIISSGELEAEMASRIGVPIEKSVKEVEAKIGEAQSKWLPGNFSTEPIKREVPKPEAAVETPDIAVVKPPPAPSPLPDLVKENYNPPAFFPAPQKGEPPLKNTHDLIDAFLRAPNWKGRIPYIYQGESLRPEIEAYYQKWDDFTLDRFKMKLFQMELEKEYGGPFWVYQVTKSDADDSGVPMILRVENGNLKVDWQVFAEFNDQHFLKFREGKIPAPVTFRLVAERMNSYPGPDRDGFTDIKDYECFQLNPPYGGFQTYSEYAFVKKGEPVLKKLDEVMKVGDEPLAVILRLDVRDFKHGIRHLVITDFVEEGWLK